MRKCWLKKAVGRLVVLLLCCTVMAGFLWENAQAVSTVTAQLKPDMTILIDSTERTFYNAGGQEVHPILYNGTTYLPVRAIGELMGKNVDWNQSTLTVTLDGVRTTPATSGTPDTTAAVQDITAELRDDFTIIIDGTVRSFCDAGGNRVYPLLYQGSTYLPVRAIGELMGKTVGWNQATQTVTLSGGDSLVTDADSFSGSSATPPAPGQPSTNTLSLEDAKAKALAHAGLTANQVTFTKQEIDFGDGQKVYELEFYTADYTEYEYEISAVNGAVLSFERDADQSGSVGASITQARAQEIVLAQVSGATVNCITKCEWDHDDRHHCYDIELLYDCIEYEFEVDGSTGAILSSESEFLYCNHAHHSDRHGHRNGYHHGGRCCW